MVLVLLAGTAQAYEVSTHRALTNAALDHQQAALAQSLAPLGLDLSDALYAYGQAQSLRGWIVQGSDDEDSLWRTRPRNHFHDPLTSEGVLGGKSAIEWMLLPPGQQVLQPWLPLAEQQRQSMSWNDARLYYQSALVSAAPADRDRYLALTFKALGHAMHLVQDASVPSHVRADVHISLCSICGPDPDDFHYWVEANNALIPGIVAVDPLPSLLTTQNQQFTLPLANLIDADRYDNFDPHLTLFPHAGVAEIAHANFFSEDTIEAQPVYLHPSPPGAADTPEVAVAGGQNYFRLLRGTGIYVEHLVVRNNAITPPEGLPQLYTIEDDSVHRDYAEKLLPLAIGYSAAVPLWFFRASIDAESIAGGAVRIENNDDERLVGTGSLFVDDAGGMRSLVATWNVDIAPHANAVGPAVALPGAARYTLVFLGEIGLESTAVAGRVLHGVAITRAGTGTGRVTSSSNAIDCGTTCTALASGGSMQLAATADAGSVFDHWEGDCSGTQSAFSLTIDTPKSCTAVFRFEGKHLSVVMSGIGQGSVTSTPAGISCGGTCTAEFATGSPVTLTATPASGSFFNGWRGACSGSSASTVVTLTSDSVCEAIFDFPSVVRITNASCTVTGNGSLSFSFQGINTGPYGTWDLIVTAFIFNGAQLAFFRPCSPLFDSSRVVYRRRADTRDWSGGASPLYCPKNSDPVRVLLQARTPFSGHNLSVDCH